MAEPHDPTIRPAQSSSSSGPNENEAGDFECNICFDLAQDPVITLCGHLYCWPCLYKWLRGHSRSHECPVCKALIEEEKVIPLYGRGKNPTDPRSKPVPGVQIPNRPAGQRPETVIPPLDDNSNNFANVVMGLMGGFVPIASATFSSFGMSAGFGGVFSPFFSVQFNGFSGSGGYHYGNTGGVFNREGRVNREVNQVEGEDDENLKKILCVVLLFVFVAFLTM